MQRFRGGLVFNAQRLCVSLNPRLESNKEEERTSVISQNKTATERGRINLKGCEKFRTEHGSRLESNKEEGDTNTTPTVDGAANQK